MISDTVFPRPNDTGVLRLSAALSSRLTRGLYQSRAATQTIITEVPDNGSRASKVARA
jgi:hypothetical protein